MQPSSFSSQGTRCAGELYLPRDLARRVPVIVMAHGFAAPRNQRLPAFAQRFAAEGYAVFLFDYRYLGESEGEPRDWVSPKRQLEDWRAAIEHVRGLPGLDPDQLVLWGTSFSGGHVLQLASQGVSACAVIAQVPHVDGFATLSQMRPRDVLVASAAGLWDLFSSALFRKPHCSPVVGKPGHFAAMNSEGSWDGWQRMIPEGAEWRNRVLSRAFLQVPFYSPGRHVDRIRIPTLVLAGEADNITPAAVTKKCADRIPDGEFQLLACGHFDPYVDEVFEDNLRRQLDFLKRILP